MKQPMGRASAQLIGISWASADAFRRSLLLDAPPDTAQWRELVLATDFPVFWRLRTRVIRHGVINIG
jgi:hypothetical protein